MHAAITIHVLMRPDSVFMQGRHHFSDNYPVQNRVWLYARLHTLVSTTVYRTALSLCMCVHTLAFVHLCVGEITCVWGVGALCV